MGVRGMGGSSVVQSCPIFGPGDGSVSICPLGVKLYTSALCLFQSVLFCNLFRVNRESMRVQE